MELISEDVISSIYGSCLQYANMRRANNISNVSANALSIINFSLLQYFISLCADSSFNNSQEILKKFKCKRQANQWQKNQLQDTTLL